MISRRLAGSQGRSHDYGQNLGSGMSLPDPYLYFRNPLYQYSLRQGIEDGFLAPYRVHRVITEWDAAGWRPTKDELDRYGRAIPDDEYQTKDFEHVIALRARTQAIAQHLTEFLKKSDLATFGWASRLTLSPAANRSV